MWDDSKIQKLGLPSPLETYVQKVLNETKTVRHIYNTEDEHLNLEKNRNFIIWTSYRFLYHIPKMSDLDDLITILKATVDVKIYRKLKINDTLTVREPVVWFRESDFSDNEKPALFVQYVKQTMCKFACCEFSRSQLEIEYLNKDDEQFLSKSEKILERGLKHMLEENIP